MVLYTAVILSQSNCKYDEMIQIQTEYFLIIGQVL